MTKPTLRNFENMTEKAMKNKALVVIDIQNDITKHYRDIVGNINAAILPQLHGACPLRLRHQLRPEEAAGDARLL